jgi:replication initiation and membrane attachment protein DnaB
MRKILWFLFHHSIKKKRKRSERRGKDERKSDVPKWGDKRSETKVNHPTGSCQTDKIKKKVDDNQMTILTA